MENQPKSTNPPKCLQKDRRKKLAHKIVCPGSFHRFDIKMMRVFLSLFLGFSLIAESTASPNSRGLGPTIFGIPRGGGLFGGKNEAKAT